MPAYPAPKSRLEFVRIFKAKVESGCSITALSITMSRYERALAKKRKKTYVPLGLIAAPICKRYGITIDQLKYPAVAPGKRRTKDDPAFYDVRAEFCRAAREKKFSYLEIAKFLNCNQQTPRNYIINPKFSSITPKHKEAPVVHLSKPPAIYSNTQSRYAGSY